MSSSSSSSTDPTPPQDAVVSPRDSTTSPRPTTTSRSNSISRGLSQVGATALLNSRKTAAGMVGGLGYAAERLIQLNYEGFAMISTSLDKVGCRAEVTHQQLEEAKEKGMDFKSPHYTWQDQMKATAHYCTEASLFISKLHSRCIGQAGFRVEVAEASLEKLIHVLGVGIPQRGAMNINIRFDPASAHIEKIPDIGPLIGYGQLWNRASNACVYGLAAARRKAHEAAYTGQVRSSMTIDMGHFRGATNAAHAVPSDVAGFEARAEIGPDNPADLAEFAQKLELTDQRKLLADNTITAIIKIVPNIAASLQELEETTLRVSAGQMVDLNPPTMMDKVASQSGKLKSLNAGLSATVGGVANSLNNAQRQADIMEGNWDKQLSLLLRLEMVIDPTSFRATTTLPECTEPTFEPDPSGQRGCLYVDCYGGKVIGKTTSDTYLKLQTSNAKDKYDYYTTEYCFNNENPAWNQRLIIPTPAGQLPSHITIRVKLEGKSIGKNKVIGQLKLDLPANLENSPVQPAWHPLQDASSPDAQLMIGVRFDANRVGPPPVGRTKMKNFKERSAAKAKATIEDSFQMSFREATKWLVFTARVGARELSKKNWQGRADVEVTGMKKYLSTSVSTADPPNEKLLSSLDKNSNARQIVEFAQKVLEGLKLTAGEMYRAHIHSGVAGISFVLPLGPITIMLGLYADVASIPQQELEEAMNSA